MPPLEDENKIKVDFAGERASEDFSSSNIDIPEAVDLSQAQPAPYDWSNVTPSEPNQPSKELKDTSQQMSHVQYLQPNSPDGKKEHKFEKEKYPDSKVIDTHKDNLKIN